MVLLLRLLHYGNTPAFIFKRCEIFFDDTLDSSNADMTDISQTFDFGMVDFDFNPHTDYIIRVEARKYADFYQRDGSILTVPGVDWTGIINRSIVTMEYSYAIPIPSPFFCATHFSVFIRLTSPFSPDIVGRFHD